MPTQRVYVTLVLCTLSLSSCYNKNQKPPAAAGAVAFDTVQLQADDAFDLSGYNNSFITNSTQHFTAAPKNVSVITAKKGLKVTVNPAVLEKEDGSAVDGKIEVSIIEITTSEELFKSNAATVSNGRLLSSGGSYYVGMECNGQQLKLKAHKSLEIAMPVLKENEMQLFYGQRDSAENMNWVEAGQPLSFNTSSHYIDYKPPYPDSLIWKPSFNKGHLYESVNSKVIFDGRQMPLKDMVNILQKRGVDKVIDTVIVNWQQFQEQKLRMDNFRYYTWKMYRIISAKQLELEKDSVAKEEKVRETYIAANRAYDEEWNRIREENSFTNQLQKYYAPAAVSKLGWINCDRFYQQPQDVQMPLDLPITMTNPVIQYFIIYKSFNGLMNGTLSKNNSRQYVLSNLPAGQQVTLIAFTKTNGQLFHCKEDFVTGNNKTIKLDFKNISGEEMSRMFGKNVRI